MFLKFFFNLLTLFIIFACSSDVEKQNLEISKKNIQDPKTQYFLAMENFYNKDFENSKKIFAEIEKIYPLSDEAIQSQIMSGYVDYLQLEYDSAILKFSRIINKYPSLKNIDYIYYMRALCYYEQITHEGLDGQYNLLALDNLNQVINRFPKSKYAKDSYQKIILVNSNIAAKHMTIGRFYQKEKKYTAALNRYRIVIDSFDETKFTPEALYRISEIYFSIGMTEDAIKTAAILGHNYPESEWYNLIYKKLKNEKQDSNFFKTLRTIF